MPAEEPGLVAELMLKSWPQRRWAARIYHAFAVATGRAGFVRSEYLKRPRSSCRLARPAVNPESADAGYQMRRSAQTCELRHV